MQFRLDTTTKKVFAGALMVAALSYAASWYVAGEQSRIATEVRGLIETQITTLGTLAETIDTDGANATVDAVVKDCSAGDRERFDYLLSNLQTLKGSSLQEVDTLFARCGDYFALRKAVMVAMLEREFAAYQSYISILQHIDARADVVTYPTEGWQSLIALEKTRSLHTAELVTVQGDIIAALRAGELVTGKAITDQLATANETKENLSLAGVQVDTLRQQLLSQ